MLLPGMNVSSIFFEVMDKEPSLVEIWIISLVLGVGGFFLDKHRYWMALSIVAFVLVVGWAQISELNDHSVGPNIIREAGYSYVVHSYVAIAFALVLPLLGAVVKWRRRRRL